MTRKATAAAMHNKEQTLSTASGFYCSQLQIKNQNRL